MSDNQHSEKCMPVFFALGFVSILCILLIACGISNPFISCFGVDSEDHLYVGLQGKIEVYDGKNLIYTINPKTSRSYVFTVLKDDTILLSTATTVYSMSLDGKILDSREDIGAQVYNDIQHNKLQQISAAGNRYSLVSSLGWSRIVKNNTDVVYGISIISFITKIILYISVACLLLSVISLAKDRIASLRSTQ